MTPQSAARRVTLILWLVMTMSIVMYFVVIQAVQPSQAQENPPLVNALLVASVGFVAASFPLKKLLAARAAAGADPVQGERIALLAALALCEAAALCGLVVWFNTAWQYYYVFLGLGLVGQLLHYPGGGEERV